MKKGQKKVSKGLKLASMALAVAEVISKKRERIIVGVVLAGIAIATLLDKRAARRLSRAIA